MANEDDKIELRLVEEDGEAMEGVVRLHNDEVEKVENMRPVKVGVSPRTDQDGKLNRDEFKTRSNEPNLEPLIETFLPVDEDTWGNQAVSKAAIPWKWIALVVFLITGVLSWSLLDLDKGEDEKQGLRKEALATVEQDEADDKAEEMKAKMVLSSLERAARGFFNASSMEEMLLYVREPERVRVLMEKHYSGVFPEAKRCVKITEIIALTIGKSASFWMVACELEGGVEGLLLVEMVSEKEAKVDWETFVCYQPMAWDEFATSRPVGYTGDFRVNLEKDHFYSHEYTDSTLFQSYRLTAHNGEEFLFGYAPRDAAFAQKLSEIVDSHPGKVTPLILRLHIPHGTSSARGVLIRELVSPTWLYSEND